MENTPIANRRRQFLKQALTAGGGALAVAGGGATARALGAVCGIATPKQVLGPFYPTDEQLGEWKDQDWNLTRKGDSTDSARGQVLYVRGYVLGEDCKPIKGASVELWQACETGRYNHPGDSENPAELDENFQYYAEQLTDAEGRYLFKTIIPGGYLASPDWFRPPHLHFKIGKKGYHELVTQMYFDGNEFNDKDLILKKIPKEQRSEVVRLVEPSPAHPDDLLIHDSEYAEDSVATRFDIHLVRVT